MNYNDLQTPIQIKNNNVFVNFTGRYLLPQIKLLGEEFNNAYRKTKWLGYGLCDRKYQYYDEYDNKIFMLASSKSNLKHWFNNYEYYVYQDGQINKIMVIVDLPINNRDNFLQGNYSKLYDSKNEHIINKFIKNNGREYLTSSWAVMNKVEEARIAFQNKVNKDFNLTEEVIINNDQEYEYPPVLSREIFNFNELVLSN